MNQFMQEQWSMYEGTHAMRTQLLDALTDAELAFNPGGANLTLGGLCRQMGEIEYSYVQSLKTLKQDWDYHTAAAGLDTSVARLKAWFAALDADMQAALAAMSDEDLKKQVERGFTCPVDVQMQIYLQALLIFFGKATIFLRAMNKPLPEHVEQWIW